MLNSSSSESSSRLALLARGLDDLEHGADVLLDGEAAKDRGFLRQIADAEPRALIHRQLGDVVAVELDGAAIRLDQAGDHVEHRGLAGAVRAEQADRFAAADIDADAAHDLAGAETLFHAMHSQKARPLDQARRRRRHWSWLAALAAGCELALARGGAVPRGRLGSGLAIRAGQRRVARHRRRIAHRARQHVAEGIAERGDVLARTRKSCRTAFGGASTEHAE